MATLSGIFITFFFEYMVVASWITPLVLRSTHLVIHLTTVALIILGIHEMPNPPKKGKLLTAAFTRASVWLVFELVYFIMASTMLIIFVVNLNLRNPPQAIARIQAWCLNNCPNFSFFYYILLSLFVLYGAMIGCNIPMLFNRVPIYPFPTTNKPNKLWQFILIGAVVAGIINSILYFVAAFYPLDRNGNADGNSDANADSTASPMKGDKTGKDVKNDDRQAEVEGERIQDKELSKKEIGPIGGLSENPGEAGENDVKSAT